MSGSDPGSTPGDASSSRSGRSGLTRPLLELSSSATTGAALLLVAAGVALVWANSPARDAYSELWGRELAIGVGRWAIREDLRHWVNDGLMTLFFLLAGLEIKRELVSGELRDRRRAALPVLAAVGGMVVPALLYLALNVGHAGVRGWGMAMPTDLALVLGVLALASSRVPPSLKVFVVTLAIADDVGTLVVVLVAYSGDLEVLWAAVAVAVLAATLVLRRAPVRWVPVYVALGLGLWLAMREAGLNPTLAGVAMGLIAPAGAASGPRTARRAEHLLLPWVSLGVLPLFALANAGVELTVASLSDPAGLRVAVGLTVARLVGKAVGITGAAWLAVRSGLGRLPEGVGWSHVVGVGAVAGIGFTVSLFVAELAFGGTALSAAARTGVLLSSAVSGVTGLVILRTVRGGTGEPSG